MVDCYVTIIQRQIGCKVPLICRLEYTAKQQLTISAVKHFIAQRDDATVSFLKNRIPLYKTVPERVKYQASYLIKENYARQYPA
jgi:hypothetical protein